MPQLRLFDGDRPRGYFVPTKSGEWFEVDYMVVDTMLPRHPKHRTKHPNPQHYYEVVRLAFDRDGWRCVLCNSNFNLEPHHRDAAYPTYGHESPGDLTTLCMPCHRLVETNKRLGRRAA